MFGKETTLVLQRTVLTGTQRVMRSSLAEVLFVVLRENMNIRITLLPLNL